MLQQKCPAAQEGMCTELTVGGDHRKSRERARGRSCGSPGKPRVIALNAPSLRNFLFAKRENTAVSMPKWNEETHP